MENRPRRREQACIYPIDMATRVTQLTKFHQLAEVHSLLGNKRNAALCIDAAVRYGVSVLTTAERDQKQKKALEEALDWLRGRDYEMHKTVRGTLDEAQAAKDMAKRMSRLANITGHRNRRRRAA